MVVLVIAIGCFYAVPNLFGEDHAVQVVATRGAEVTASTQARVNELLASKGIAVKRSELEKRPIVGSRAKRGSTVAGQGNHRRRFRR